MNSFFKHLLLYTPFRKYYGYLRFIYFTKFRSKLKTFDINNLLIKLNLPNPTRELSEYKKNKSRPDKNWEKMYSTETKNLVATHFKFYLDLFNYEF